MNDQRPASCSRTKNGMPRWAASVAVTAHSAVDGVCAPRALHRTTPVGQPADEALRTGAEQLDQRAAGAAPRGSSLSGSAGAARARDPDLRLGGLAGRRAVGGVDPVRAHAGRERLDAPRRCARDGTSTCSGLVGAEGQAGHGRRL